MKQYRGMVMVRNDGALMPLGVTYEFASPAHAKVALEAYNDTRVINGRWEIVERFVQVREVSEWERYVDPR